MSISIQKSLAQKSTRTQAAIKVCQEQLHTEMSALLNALDKMSWAEIGEVTPYLAYLGVEAVPHLCTLLKSSRKQTIEAITTALGEIGDARAAFPLIQMMEEQVGQANAIRARDALIQLGFGATPALLEALQSSKWEVRYHAVQALAVIGDRDAIPDLADAAENDRSTKVKEAADEATQVIPSVDQDEMYNTQQGFYNPGVIMLGILPDWQVDVINGYQPTLVWGFDTAKLFEQQDMAWDQVALRAVLQSYQAIGKVREKLDVILFLGTLVEEDEFGIEHDVFCVALSGIGVHPERAQDILGLLKHIETSLSIFPGSLGSNITQYIEPDFIPYFHLNKGKVTRYDFDESYTPISVQQDSAGWFGTGFRFTFAKAVVDSAWLVRERLPILKEQGMFTHIPTARTVQNVETRTEEF